MGVRGVVAGLMVLGIALWSAGAQAQLVDDPRVSTQGTQFVGAPPPAPPPAPPAAAAPQAPSPPVPPVPPQQPVQAAVSPPAAEEPPRYPSVVILLDVSDSMLAKSPGHDVTRLDEAKNAVAAVIRGMSDETRVQLWTFSTRMGQVTLKGGRPRAFTAVGESSQRDGLLDKIREIRTGGGTNLYLSVIQALELFSDPRDQEAYRSGQRFPVLVVVSDGEDWGKSGHTLEQVQAAKRKFPLVTVNAIGFTVGQQDPWFKTLCQIATQPSGCATADHQAQLMAILESFYRPRPQTARNR